MYYIYFIREFLFKNKGRKQLGFVKIGVAKNVELRIKELETGNARDFEILATIKYKSKTQAFFEEKRLHHTFRKIHIKREWFKNKIDFGRVKALYQDVLFVHKDCFYKRQKKNKNKPNIEDK